MNLLLLFVLIIFAEESYGGVFDQYVQMDRGGRPGSFSCEAAKGTCMNRKKHCCASGFKEDFDCPQSVDHKCCLSGDDICRPQKPKSRCRENGGVCRPRTRYCSSDYVEGLCENNNVACCFPETECERRGGRCVNANEDHHCPKALETGMCLDDNDGYQCCVHSACGRVIHDLACSILSGSTTMFHGSLPGQQSNHSAYQNVVESCFGSKVQTDPSCPVDRVCLHPGVLQLIDCIEGICGTLKVKWIAGGCDLEDCFSHCKGNAVAFLMPEDCDSDSEMDVQRLYTMCADLGGHGTMNQHGYITCTFTVD